MRKGEGKLLVLLVLMLPAMALGVTGNQQIYVTYPAWEIPHRTQRLCGRDRCGLALGQQGVGRKAARSRARGSRATNPPAG